MFESAIVNLLRSDAALSQYLAKFANVPAVFADSAPESAVMPFIEFSIDQSIAEDPTVMTFRVIINYFDYNKSKEIARNAALRIIDILDQQILTHERFDAIRMVFFSGGFSPPEDAREINYSLQFTARAVRKKWIVDNH
jgi:hypothetical protein